jgi:hypothetical protein
MGLFEKMADAKGVQMLCGVVLSEARDMTEMPNTWGRVPSGTRLKFLLEPASAGRKAKPSDYILLALHYQSQALARYPRSDAKLDPIGMDLRWRAGKIIEEGIWADSDLLNYAGVTDKARMVRDRSALGTQGIRTFNAALIRPLAGDDLDMALELPPDVTPEELNISVFALMQGVLWMMDDEHVQLMDRAFRYLKSYWDEGAEYGDPAAARNMANRALRDAGADAA